MNTRHQTGLDLSGAGLNRDVHNQEYFGTYPNNLNLATKTAILDSYLPMWNRFFVAMVKDPIFVQMATGTGRIWFSPSAVWSALDDAAFNRLRARMHQLSAPVFVLHSPEQMLTLAREAPEQARKLAPLHGQGPTLTAKACVPAAITHLSYDPDFLAFQFEAPSAGYLLVTDRWAPGWEAKVNGKSRTIFGGDFTYRAVEVDSGRNMVEFRYRPRGFRPLLILSWGMLLAIGIGQCARLASFRNKRVV
jgi:hypothetical protein